MFRNLASTLSAAAPALLIAAVAAIASAAAIGQEPPEFPGPVEQHKFLKKFVGEWESSAQCMAMPDAPPCQGTMKARMLGGFWLVIESKAEMMGTTMNSIQTLGFDPEQGKYVGTWVDSMMNHMWKYEGVVEGNTLTLSADGPNFLKPGETAKFQDIYEFKSDGEVTITSKMLTDGEWVVMMSGTATRKSAGN